MKKLLLLSIPVAAYIILSVTTKSSSFEKYHVDMPKDADYSVGPPVGKTGAPIDGNCTDCHSGSVLDPTGTVTVTYSDAGDVYYPGETYTFTLTFASGTKNGFEATLLDGSNEMAGSFTAGTDNEVILAGSTEYVRHIASVGITSWDFQWTAPSSDAGSLRLYFAANQSNSDGTFNGDEIYVGQYNINPAADVGLTKFDKLNEAYKVSYNPHSDEVNLEYMVMDQDRTVINVQDLNGRLIQQFDLGLQAPGQYKESVKVDGVDNDGIYLVSIFLGNEVFNRKVYLK